MKSLQDLPLLPLSIILSNLSVKDLVNCRLVSKQMNFAARIEMKTVFKELVLWNSNHKAFLLNKWYFTNDLKKEKIKIRVGTFKREYLLIPNDFVVRVKRISFMSIFDEKDFYLVNAMKQLEVLEIYSFSFYDSDQARLILPDLKILYVFFVYGNGITIDTPNLKVFCCIDFWRNLKIEHLNSIRFLQLGNQKWRGTKIFSNVQVYRTDRAKCVFDELFDMFPKLEKIFLDDDILSRDADKMNSNETELVINRLIRQRKEFDRFELMIFVKDKLLEIDTPLFTNNFEEWKHY